MHVSCCHTYVKQGGQPCNFIINLSQIMDHGAAVLWDDIAGLHFAKATIKEIVVWPMLRP